MPSYVYVFVANLCFPLAYILYTYIYLLQTHVYHVLEIGIFFFIWPNNRTESITQCIKYVPPQNLHAISSTMR